MTREIMERLERDPEVRPLVDSPNPMTRIEEIMREREKEYARFPQVVTSGKSPEELTTLLIEIIQSESV